MFATCPPEPVMMREQVCVQHMGKLQQFSFTNGGDWCIRIDSIQAFQSKISISLRPRMPLEAGLRLVRIARPIAWPKDERDSEY